MPEKIHPQQTIRTRGGANLLYNENFYIRLSLWANLQIPNLNTLSLDFTSAGYAPFYRFKFNDIFLSGRRFEIHRVGRTGIQQ